MLSRAMAQDEIITEDDIIWRDVAQQRLGQNVVLSTRNIVGQAARRPLRAGVAIRTSDVRKPILIRKGTLITMRIQTGALSLSAVGRAMDDGGEGDIIRIVNIDSHQSVEDQIRPIALWSAMQGMLGLADKPATLKYLVELAQELGE